MKQKRYIRLSPDFDVLYIDQESCCYDAYGDEIYNDNLELGPLFCFAMPGIEEWQNAICMPPISQRQQPTLHLTG